MESVAMSAVGTVVNHLYENFAKSAWSQVDMFIESNEDLKKLERNFLRMVAFTDKIENSGQVFTNETMRKAWQRFSQDLKKICYQIEDLLDDILMEVSRRERKKKEKIDYSEMNFSKFKGSVCNSVKNLQAHLDRLDTEMDRFVTTESSLRVNLNYSTSLVRNDLIIGRDKEVKEVLELLTHGSTREIFSVISIVGICGIGKSALAQVVYEEAADFDMKIWVSASEFDVVNLTRSIYLCAIEGEESVGDLCVIQADLNILQLKLKKKLRGKKYLIVLDGYLSVSFNDWKVLSLPFNSGKSGSTVIITTQSDRVASMVGSISNYFLEPIAVRKCWRIMKQYAFSKEDIIKSEPLAHVGRQIAKKCCGLPLVAVSLGSMLSSNFSLNIWESISRSELWNLPLRDNGSLSLFIQNFRCLPNNLKMCLLYSSLFPPDHYFEMDDVVRLWVAEGFIQPVEEIRAEQIGRNYFNDLVSKFFIQIVDSKSQPKNEEDPPKNEEGQPRNEKKINPTYKMHAIYYGMTKLFSEGMCFQLEAETSNWNVMLKNARHVSVDYSAMHLLGSDKFDNPNLSTLMVVDKDRRKCDNKSRPRFDIPSTMMKKMDYLRVLVMCCCGIVDLPKTIQLLKHLRCLNLSDNPIVALPNEVCKLLALQILKLRECNYLKKLPEDLTKLVNLHQLDIDSGDLEEKPSHLGKLTALQFLEDFFVQDVDGHRIEELGNMSFLEGSLTIWNLDEVHSIAEASKANLKEKPYLNVLKFNWSKVNPDVDVDLVLEGLMPHENLQELWIYKYGGSSFPDWFSISRPRLSKLCLNDLPNCKDLPWLGQLPLLISLHIINMPKLTELTIAFGGNAKGGFPRLESLLFSQLPMFAKWDGIFDTDLPCLTDLTFEYCPKLKEFPKGKFALKRLTILKCDILKWRCRKGGEDWPIVQKIEKVSIDEGM